ncbi:MAG: hypothetical protein ABL927_09900 [Bdellovibrionales bacterium]
MGFRDKFIQKDLINFETFNNEINWSLINPDFEYINWAIHNLEWFFVEPEYFNCIIKIIDRIETDRIKEYLLEFEPITISVKVKDFFTDDTIKLNATKFSKKYNLAYNDIYDKYFVVNTDTVPIFDYLTNIDTKYSLEDFIEEDDDDDYSDDYKYNSNNWLRDASGSNDSETMNDVFWNLD